MQDKVLLTHKYSRYIVAGLRNLIVILKKYICSIFILMCSIFFIFITYVYASFIAHAVCLNVKKKLILRAHLALIRSITKSMRPEQGKTQPKSYLTCQNVEMWWLICSTFDIWDRCPWFETGISHNEHEALQ